MIQQGKQRKGFPPLFQLRNGSKGLTVVEILVAVAIIGVVFATLLGGTVFALRQAQAQEERSKAAALAQEGLEAVRAFRDSTDWDVDGLGSLDEGSYEIQVSGNQWSLVSGTETVNGFERVVILEDVRRDGSSNIVESGGTLDPDSRFATVRVSWNIRGQDQQMEATSLFTNWK